MRARWLSRRTPESVGLRPILGITTPVSPNDLLPWKSSKWTPSTLSLTSPVLQNYVS